MVMLKELHATATIDVDNPTFGHWVEQGRKADDAGVVRYLELLRAMAAVGRLRAGSPLS
ncbi:hypothetical protein G4X40_10865 [Rhodococcus sp. D2-41]|uniref:hypothetical protein n=1 Tax=Speluncibacter jeojiensis TaxID=2710754 RepID=UPI002410AD38|nr:hypothetical protein [Rhodococcus sp. D2-41]MDG3010649.1 hypothetical protein [Rhodococcus sp. D2-41]